MTIKLKNELWHNNTLIDVTWEEGIVVEKEDGYYLADRKLELLDEFTIT